MVITRYTLQVNQKIAVLADIHNTMFDLSLLEKEKVDLILIPGDICSDHLSKESAEADDKLIDWTEPTNALRLLKALPQIAPTYFSKGNHESCWNETDKEILNQTGTVLLDNDVAHCSNTVVCGIGSPSRHSNNTDDLTDTVKFVISEAAKEQGTKILLLHEPHLYFKYGLGQSVIDLVISGHAHGGQWRFFNQGVLAPGQGLFPKYTKGLYDGKLLVSAGMSNTAHLIPRLFNPQEIVIIEPMK